MKIQGPNREHSTIKLIHPLSLGGNTEKRRGETLGTLQLSPRLVWDYFSDVL